MLHLMKLPRIALFSDSNDEPSGVSGAARAIEACAKRRNIPLLSVNAGSETRLVHDGSIVRLDLKRSRTCSIGIEQDMRFDVSMCRHISRVRHLLRWFAPDVLHLTGPSDVGQLGAYLGRRQSIPMVASWHPYLHQYVSRQLQFSLTGASRGARVKSWVEEQSLRALLRFYKTARVVLVPDLELASLVEHCTGTQAFLMSRGVDTTLFTPKRRVGSNAIANIGYVGRLSADKHVRLLQDLEATLDGEGLDVRFTIVGDGSERAWLQRNMLRAEFPGILRGPALADAYAQMDVFACPSETDMFGDVALEAMASGVPVVAMAIGRQRFAHDPGHPAILAANRSSFIQGVRTLVKNRRRCLDMGAAARAWAVDLPSWDRIFIDICNAYDAALSPAEGDGRSASVNFHEAAHALHM
jgi:glycosyltransferase involved in cell wall biosynthesis